MKCRDHSEARMIQNGHFAWLARRVGGAIIQNGTCFVSFDAHLLRRSGWGATRPQARDILLRSPLGARGGGMKKGAQVI